MFAIGHFALGYLTGKTSATLLKTKLNLPLLLVISIIPDIDLLLQYVEPTLFMHRGPPHSILTYIAIIMPFLLIYKKKALPYFVALLSHSLLGDFFTGGIELFWPITQEWFGAIGIEVMSLTNAALELTLFAVALPIMFKSKDLQTLLKPNNHNLFLIIPFGALLGPMLQLGQGTEMSMPVFMMAPSVFYLCLFGYSILMELNTRLNKPLTKPNPQPSNT